MENSGVCLPLKQNDCFQPGFVSHLQSLVIKPFCGLIFLD